MRRGYHFSLFNLGLTYISALFPLQIFLPMVGQLVMQKLLPVLLGKSLVQFPLILLVEKLREIEPRGWGKECGLGYELRKWPQYGPGSHAYKHPYIMTIKY